MKLRRGFKTDANWYARDLRSSMQLRAHDPLCPWQLAQHLEIPVVPLSEFNDDVPDVVNWFLRGSGRSEFSAMTICDGPQRWIVYNDGHSRKRQAANISHELSHCILIHPSHPIADAAGNRHFDAWMEEEAAWLGPALLISDEAALHIVASGWSVSYASNHYGVSEQLVRMRINVTGARKRVSAGSAA